MAQPHLVNDSIALDGLAIVMTLFGLSLFVFAIRIYTRVYPKYKLDASDYNLSIAVISRKADSVVTKDNDLMRQPFAILAHSLYITAVSQGLGRHTVFVPPDHAVKILRYMFIIQLAWTFATCFARISVACMLLPFAISRAWELAIKTVIGVQILLFISNSSYALAKCRPLRAAWENVPDKKCVGEEVRFSFTVLVICVSLVSDLAVAIMPVFVIWKLSRSCVERCLISVLMMMGLMAGTTEVVKLVYANTFRYSSADVFRTIVPLFFWTRLEESALLFSASAPLLKAPIEGALHRLGLPAFHNIDRGLGTYDS
ncbi:hypothetical protein GQ44DRAFT_675982 [Phaeosphaeriaceae sp. PMI808]|nr:hypothetical protein GQ44DRAFT_675982 [Phaeosphaeriaceae sp. PMI808]